MSDERLDLETELIESSLLPAERLVRDGGYILITSDDSNLSIRVAVSSGYPARQSITVEIKGEHIARDEAQSWKEWAQGTVDNEWDPSDE